MSTIVEKQDNEVEVGVYEDDVFLIKWKTTINDPHNGMVETKFSYSIMDKNVGDSEEDIVCERKDFFLALLLVDDDNVDWATSHDVYEDALKAMPKNPDLRWIP